MSGHYHHIARLRIELEGTNPLVWRRVDVPLDLRLRRVHEVIRAVFDWNSSHLHQFEVAGRLYGLPKVMGQELAGMRLYSDKNAKLGGVIDRGAKHFTYLYDYGDSWEHEVFVEDVFEP